MLLAYETAVQQLIQLVPSGLIPLPTLDTYINTARMQLAADAECVRAVAILNLTTGQQAYDISALQIPGGAAAGINYAISVRDGFIQGQEIALEFRPWEWYAQYARPISATGAVPQIMAQQGQGDLGTLYFAPIPNTPVTAVFDAACIPLLLTDDASPEAIPYPWTDAVQFYAAWLAMMQLQRQADAQLMLARYKELALRGRQEVTPTELPDNMPGGAGARAAALKTTLTMAPQQQALGR